MAKKGDYPPSWKNMLNLEARIDPGAIGHFGVFVDRGTIFVTDLKLERLGPA